MTIKELIHILLRIRKIVIQKDILFFPKPKNNLLTLGDEGGAWTFSPTFINEKSIIYSVGIGNDISFDLAIIEKFNVQIFAYDPTPKCIEWLKQQPLPENLKFIPLGLASYDGELQLNLPLNPDHVSASAVYSTNNTLSFKAKVNRLSSLMSANGHSAIDLLKIDIEGSEYEVIDDIIKYQINIKQLLIEFHHRFSEIGIDKTKNAVHNLVKVGYSLEYINQKTGEEYTFIKNT